ncbi:hypothetical protein ACIBAI_17005 [Streptomyces sp. NPDC051041]|uniref:hypothetical protein n=1 Tax=Streptomyces sp. NPDC051041 TaxID=3365640 RepID=UPI00378EEF68
MLLTHRARPAAPLSPSDADLVRIVRDPRTPVFLTVHAGGRRRYSYWQPFDPATGRGSCYVALPTDACDRLHSTGRITLSEPIVDPGKTVYRVQPADTPAEPAPVAYRRARAA